MLERIPLIPESTYQFERKNLGETPFYYNINSKKNEVLVSTSLKELVQEISNPELDCKFIKNIWNHNFCHQSLSPFHEISKLPPSSILKIHNRKGVLSTQVEMFGPVLPLQTELKKSEIIDQIEQELLQNLKYLETKSSALFLSGGLDSTLLFAIIQKHKLGIPAVKLSFPTPPERDTFSEDYLTANYQGQYEQILFEENIFIKNSPWYRHCLAFYNLNLDLYTPLFEWAQRCDKKNIITGLGGDDLFTLNSTYLFPLLRQNKNWQKKFQIIRDFFNYFGFYGLQTPMAGELPPKLKKLVKSLLKKETTYDEFMENSIDTNYLTKLLNWRLLKAGTYSFGMEQEQERAQMFNLKMHYPFMQKSIMQLAISAPLNDFVRFPQDKPLLRELAKRYLSPEFANHLSKQTYLRVVELHRKLIIEPLVSNFINEQPNSRICGLHLHPSMLGLDTDQLLKLLYFQHAQKIIEDGL